MKGMELRTHTHTHAPAIRLGENSKAAGVGSPAFGALQSKVSGFRVQGLQGLASPEITP